MGRRGSRSGFSFPQPCALGSARGKTRAAERKWGLSSPLRRGSRSEAELERQQEKVRGWRRRRRAAPLSLLWPGGRDGWASRLSPCLLNSHLSEEQTGRSSWPKGAREEASSSGRLCCAPWRSGRGGRWARRCSPTL